MIIWFIKHNYYIVVLLLVVIVIVILIFSVLQNTSSMKAEYMVGALWYVLNK